MGGGCLVKGVEVELLERVIPELILSVLRLGAFKSTYSLTISVLYKLQQLLTSISYNWGLPISTFKMVLHAPIHQFVLFSCLVF